MIKMLVYFTILLYQLDGNSNMNVALFPNETLVIMVNLPITQFCFLKSPPVVIRLRP